MSTKDPFSYEGKRVLVVGGATGMGAAAARGAAERGAEVVIMDFATVDQAGAQAISVDLRDEASIDTALGQLEGPIDAIFSAAGMADAPFGLMRVNFIGHRKIIEALIASGQLGRGSAICFISSVAGIGWEPQLPKLVDFLSMPDYTSAVDWVGEHEFTDTYPFSKWAINAYVARESFPLMAQGIRINAICPGPTDTPLAQANAELWLGFGKDYRAAVGIPDHSPEQMANAMLFLNSSAASGVSGVNLLVDSGHVMSSLSESYAQDKPLVDMLFGRF